MLERRTLLRSLAGLPLLGGSLAIVGAPSAPVSLVQAATLSGIADPHERARYAWQAFASAMDDVAAGLDGWLVRGGSRLTPIPHFQLKAETWGSLDGVRYAYQDTGNPRGPFVSEHRTDLGFSL